MILTKVQPPSKNHLRISGCEGCSNGSHVEHFHLRRQGGELCADEAIVIGGYGKEQRGVYLWLGRDGKCLAIVCGPATVRALADGLRRADGATRGRT